MELAKRCFKLDKPNAQAMISGLPLSGDIRHQSIWLDVVRKPFPMLITLQRSRTRFRLSELGKRLASEGFSIPYKYVAALNSEYFVENDLEMWKTMCANGLLDMWDPIAPHTRLAQSKRDPSCFRIQLLRIYEIDREFSQDDIVAASTRIDHLVVPNRTVTVKCPIVADDEFAEIKATLISSISPYLPGAHQGPSATQVRNDVASLELEDEFWEGERKSRYTSYYERNPGLRLAAIRYHGTTCKVCGFDFEKVYGQHGTGFIEVHHLAPVSQLKATRRVNPQKDMTVVCSNCHRMIHRVKDSILSPAELRELLGRNRPDQSGD